jgi:uncharacterized membrane protein YsdA (DUF1294 family)
VRNPVLVFHQKMEFSLHLTLLCLKTKGGAFGAPLGEQYITHTTLGQSLLAVMSLMVHLYLHL